MDDGRPDPPGCRARERMDGVGCVLGKPFLDFAGRAGVGLCTATEEPGIDGGLGGFEDVEQGVVDVGLEGGCELRFGITVVVAEVTHRETVDGGVETGFVISD